MEQSCTTHRCALSRQVVPLEGCLQFLLTAGASPATLPPPFGVRLHILALQLMRIQVHPLQRQAHQQSSMSWFSRRGHACVGLRNPDFMPVPESTSPTGWYPPWRQMQESDWQTKTRGLPPIQPRCVSMPLCLSQQALLQACGIIPHGTRCVSRTDRL